MINEVTTYGKYFLMTQDINLGGQSNEFTPIQDFSGTFDGGGKEISGLYINQSATDYYHGLFDNLYGTVKNLGVSGNVTGGNYVGGIAGRLSGGVYEGAEGTIINCYNNCIVGGERAVGGIAGYLQDGTVINCYNIGKVSGTTNIGGIAGYMSGICTLENSYNHSAVNGRSNAGAICGYSSSGNVVTNCYWASNVTEAPTAGVGNYDTTTSMTSAAMQLVSFSTKLNNNAYEYNADNTDSEQACAWVTVSSSTPVLDFSDITPDYTTPATYSGGDGSIDTPYQITTAADLRDLAMMVNSGETYYGDYFTMTQSIDLGGESEEFTAIGSSIAPFNGSFNGGNNEVSGLYINQSESDYQALFGYISTKAVIENLGVSGKVTGGDYVGGLVGCLYGSTLATGPNVTNCWSNVEVNGNNHVGGLAGEAIYSYIYNSYNKGTVSGADYIGGVIGSIDYTVYLTNIYNTATVTGDNDVAGVVGYCQSSYMKYITNCYNSGNITGNEGVGGIIGDAGVYTILYTCYNSGTVQGEIYVGAIIGAATSSLTQSSCYWAEGSSNAGIGEYSGTDSTISISTTAMQNDDFVVTLNNAAATYNGSYSTRPQSCAWSAESNSLPELDFDAAPIFSESSTYSGGDGSSETPFLISTAADLRELSTNINSGTTYSENFYLMTNNINLEGVDSNNNGIEDKKFTSIGHNNINDFEGEFDGGGYEISGLYINSDSTCEGLFGYSTSATIKNLSVTGVINGNSKMHVGGIVGYDSGSYITNCESNCIIYDGGNNTGGIAGYITRSNITNCRSIGTIDGAQYVGGIAGYASTIATITNCYSSTAVTGDSEVGGIAGFLSETSSSSKYYATTENCYWAKDVADAPSAGVGSGTDATTDMTTAQMEAEDFVLTLISGAAAYNAANTSAVQACSWSVVGGSLPELNFSVVPSATY